MIEHIRAISPPPPPNEDPNPQFVHTSLTDKLTCSICCEVVRSPVQLSCEHTICSHCCCKSIQVAYSLQCPCCYSHTLSSKTISSPSPLFMSLLNESVVSCIRKCGKMVKLQDYSHHLDHKCKTHYVNTNSPSKVTLKDVLCKPTTSPATVLERKAAHHLVRRLIYHGEGSSKATGVIKVPTSGQVNTYYHCTFIVNSYVVKKVHANYTTIAPYLDASPWLPSLQF